MVIASIPRYVIRHLSNKDRDQGSQGIWGLGIERIVTSNNCVLRHLCVFSVRRFKTTIQILLPIIIEFYSMHSYKGDIVETLDYQLIPGSSEDQTKHI